MLSVLSKNLWKVLAYGERMVKLICQKCGNEMREVHEGSKVYWVCDKCGNIVKPKRKKKKGKERKMSKKKQIEKLKEFAKKFVEVDKIDFESIVDGSLTYEENLEIVKEYIRKLNPEANLEEVDIEEMERSFREHYRKMIIEEFNRDIEEIKRRKTPELEKYFRTLKELVKIAVRGRVSGLIVYGEAGLGKTYTVLQTLAEMGKRLGEDYIYISTHITPLELVNMLYKYQDRIIVIDDVEKLLEDLKTIGILKSALWSSVNGTRIITYYSTSEKLEAPEEFEFKGKVILLLNRIPKKNKEIVESLLSRVLTYRLHFSYEERLKIMYEMAKVFNIPLEVVDFLKEKFTPALENFNFRTLIQLNLIYEYYKQYPSQLNGSSWKVIGEKLLEQNTNPIMQKVWELINSSKSVKEQVEEFRRETGMSRRTYFRYKAKLEEMFGKPL